MADDQTPSRRKNVRLGMMRTSMSSPETPSEDESKGQVKFQIGGDSTPFVDDNEPLMTAREGSPDSVQSVSVSIKEPLRQVFVELFELHLPEPGKGGEAEWEETARWIRYEEDVEGADHRWGRPHVAFLTFHSLLQLRYCIAKGAMILGAKANSYPEICQQIVDAMSKEFNIDENRAKIIHNALERKHKHATEPRHLFSLRGSMVSPKTLRAGHSHTAPTMSGRSKITTTPKASEAAMKRTDSNSSVRSNRFSFLRRNGQSSTELMRKLPVGAESAQVFVGQLSELRKVRFCMVRLDQGVTLPELLDAPIPIRFIFVIVGPPLPDVDYHEIGRAVATLMSNPAFSEVAYVAQSREALLAGVDLFLDGSLVIPPGEIEKKSLFSVDAIKKALRRRCESRQEYERLEMEKRTPHAIKPQRSREKQQYDPLQRTGKFFAGVANDVKHRFPKYWSDIRDAFHFQCLTSLVFMFFAALAPAISFGGLLGEKVDNWMGPSEVLVAQALCGIVWGLFSCQPVLIMAATGPVLIFEESLYTFSKARGLEFMVLRVWTGFWVLFLAILTVAFEGSFLVRYITRFTEDIFATLISLIFCFESIKFMIANFKNHPVKNLDIYCITNTSNTSMYTLSPNGSSFSSNFTTELVPFNMSAQTAVKKTGQPDTALLSAAFLVATFALAFALRQLRTSVFFSRTVRRAIGDFGVPIAMLVIVLLDTFVFTFPYLERLQMPEYFSPSDPSKRGWFINPLGQQGTAPTWMIFAAIIPALLVYILIFVEIEITQLLLATKERGLHKGSGFHYDLVLVGVLVLVCSLMGLPWMCAAAVQSLAHASSLTIMKRKAPGERPQVDTVLEQRVTTIGVALLMGSCAFLGTYLKHVPLATLFGIFLYLGVISMIGIQFLQRIVLVFMPQKHHPDVNYCKTVRMWRMHLYTFVQILCLIVLWIIKSIKMTSLAFPFILMLVAVLRKFLMPCIFTVHELKALDGHDDPEEDNEAMEHDFYQEAILPL